MIEDVNDATYHDTGGNGIDDTAGLDTDGDDCEDAWIIDGGPHSADRDRCSTEPARPGIPVSCARCPARPSRGRRTAVRRPRRAAPRARCQRRRPG